jgi:hypothetical protein
MPCCWEYDFSIAGPKDQLDVLKVTLPQLRFEEGGLLFHEVEIMHEAGVFFAAHADRNYGGLDAVAEMVARFPDLTFHGSAWCDVADDGFFIYEGRGGEISVTDHVMPDCEVRELEPSEIEQEMAKLAEKINRLETRRLELQERLIPLHV